MPLPPWTPDLRALELLLSVAELGSVGKAARAHLISQPSASATLSRLERRLGVPLLVRTTRGTTLTTEGRTVAEWARGVVESAWTLADGVTALHERGTGHLRVAASLTTAEHLLPGWLLTLRAAHPDAVVGLAVVNSTEVLARVHAGAADLGLVETPQPPRGVRAELIGRDRLVLAVSPRHDLARRRERPLRPNELLDLPVLVREPGSGTRETFVAALAAATGTTEDAVLLPRAVELGSTTTIVSTALAGGGVAVVSECAVASELGAGTLVELPVTGLDLGRPLHAVWLRGAPPGLAAALIAVARDSQSVVN